MLGKIVNAYACAGVLLGGHVLGKIVSIYACTGVLLGGHMLGKIVRVYACAGVLLGGHVRAVFSLVLIIFIICVTITLTSFREIPLDVLTAPGIRVRQLTVKLSN